MCCLASGSSEWSKSRAVGTRHGRYLLRSRSLPRCERAAAVGALPVGLPQRASPDLCWRDEVCGFSASACGWMRTLALRPAPSLGGVSRGVTRASVLVVLCAAAFGLAGGSGIARAGGDDGVAPRGGGARHGAHGATLPATPTGPVSEGHDVERRHEPDQGPVGASAGGPSRRSRGLVLGGFVALNAMILLGAAADRSRRRGHHGPHRSVRA